ncbi:hypothetical protein D9M68_731970 [compost metagenome]
MQNDLEINIEAFAKTTAKHGDRFIDAKTQGFQPQPEKYPSGLQFGGLQVEAATRGHKHPQIRRRVVQEIGQGHTNGGVGQHVDFVEHECHLAAKIGHLRQPFRQASQGIAVVHGLIGRTGECLPTAGHHHGRRQPLDEANAVVAAIHSQPGDYGAARKEFPAPLRQQPGLAEPGRRMNRNGHARGQLIHIEAQALAPKGGLLASRRRGLEYQLWFHSFHC